MKANALRKAETPVNLITLSTATRQGRMPKSDTNTVGHRQRFRILDFVNESGTKSHRVQGMTREGKYVRENFADRRKAEVRRLELETEFLSQAAAHIELPRVTALSSEQLRIAEAAFKRLERAEADNGDLLHAVDQWLRGGRKKQNGDTPRLDEAVEEFKKWLASTPELRERSKSNLRTRINVFANSIGNLRVDAITADTVDEFLSKRGNVSATTKDGDKRVLSRFFGWCMERPRRWMASNPARDVRVAKGEKAPPAVLTVAECESLLRAAQAHKEGRLVPYVAVCLFGGLRPFEAARLTWRQVNLADNEIRLEANQTKTGRGRVVSIVPTIHGADGKRIPGPDALRTWLEAYRELPFNPPNWRKDFDAIKRAAGFGGRTADAKKTAARSKPAVELKEWPEDVMRHTAVSHFFRLTHSYGQTAEQFGNSETIIKVHYQGRVSSDETAKFYGILPTQIENI